MLFVTKNGVRREIVKALQPMLRACDKIGGMPDGFWEDEVILGCLSGYIRGMIQVLSSNRYQGSDIGEITIGVFEGLAPGRGTEISRTALQLMAGPRFVEAVAGGIHSVMISRYGIDKVADVPMVIAARERAKLVPTILQSGDEKDAVAGELLHTYLYGRIIEMKEMQEA